MTAPTYEKTRPAARFVERHALDAADEQWLKEVLGLVRPDGSLAPDDNNVYVFKADHAGKAPAAKVRQTKKTRDRSAVPDGLRDLPPETAEEAPAKRPGPKPQPKVVRPRRPRVVPPCGSYKAFSRHKRRGEEVDTACLDASREYSRNYQRERRKAEELKRLTDAGVNEATATVLSELAR